MGKKSKKEKRKRNKQYSKAIKRKQSQKKKEKEEQKSNEVKTKKEERKEFIVNYLQYSVEEQRDIRLYREGIEQKKKVELWRNIEIVPKLEREEYTTSEYKGIKYKYER